MLCPICKQELKSDSNFQYEDVCNSLIYSAKWMCNNEKCELHLKSFWNDSGDFFTGDLDYDKTNELFPHDTYAALNSFAKKCEVEIYGKVVKNGKLRKRKIYLSPWFTFRWLQPYIEFKYKSNEMGEVLGRSWKLQFLKKQKGRKQYCIHYISGLHMFKFYLNQFNRDLKNYKENKSRFALLNIQKHFTENDNRTYVKVFNWYLINFYGKLLQTSNNYSEFCEKLHSNVSKNNVTMEDGSYLEKISWLLPKDIKLIDELINLKYKGEYITYKLRERKINRII